MLRKPARRQIRSGADLPKKFGDLVNADHIIANSDEAMGLTGERNAIGHCGSIQRLQGLFPIVPQGRGGGARGAQGVFRPYDTKVHVDRLRARTHTRYT